jgi:hypothetical protein
VSSYKIVIMKGYDPLLDPYKDFIYSTFLRSLRYGNDWFKIIDSKSYHKAYQALITHILNRSNTEVRVALLSEDLDIALGWSIYEGKTLHYVYVKGSFKDQASFRQLGIGTALLPEEFTSVSHMTKLGKAIWQEKYPKVIFNPFQ